jgi:hypothetical protein
LGELTLRGASDSERQAVVWVAETLQELEISVNQLERIGTDVAEAVRNAMKQGPRAVSIRVLTSPAQRLRSNAGQTRDEQPTLRGWGYFILQRRAADGREAQLATEGAHYMIELLLYREGGEDRAASGVKEVP